MRNFYFVIFNESDSIIDRYNLDVVTDLSGLGYNLSLTTISGDVEDYVTKIVQKKKNLGLTIYHRNRYTGYNSLCAWLESHIDDNTLLVYDDGINTLYTAGYVVNTSKTEINEYGILEQKIEFQPLTPFFEKIDNDIYITVASSGKSYPFKYPYQYGKNVVENNSINNTYIKEIPINVTITGTITNPIITLLDADNNIYNEIRFLSTDLSDGQKIIINSAQKKIWYDDGTGDLVDYYGHIDGSYDSFLRAKPFIISSLGINFSASDTGRLVGSRRQYRLR